MIGSRGGKSTTSDYHALDVREFQRDGLLGRRSTFITSWSMNGERTGSIGVQSAGDALVLTYKTLPWGADDWRQMNYSVALDWTPCHYGGRRVWFRCPTQGCSRRVAILYGGTVFACRNCHRIDYESQHEQRYGSAIERMQKIRMRLGGTGSMAEDFPYKPRGMHWKTYDRLCRQYEVFDNFSAEELFRRVFR